MAYTNYKLGIDGIFDISIKRFYFNTCNAIYYLSFYFKGNKVDRLKIHLNRVKIALLFYKLMHAGKEIIKENLFKDSVALVLDCDKMY